MCVVPPSDFFPHRSVSFPSLSDIYDGDRLRKVLRRRYTNAADTKMGATEEKVDRCTEIRIASSKPFAAGSTKDDASVGKIASTGENIVAWRDLADGADKRVRALRGEIDASNKRVRASFERVHASQDDEEEANENVQPSNHFVDASFEQPERSRVPELAPKKRRLASHNRRLASWKEHLASRKIHLASQKTTPGATEKWIVRRSVQERAKAAGRHVRRPARVCCEDSPRAHRCCDSSGCSRSLIPPHMMPTPTQSRMNEDKRRNTAAPVSPSNEISRDAKR